MRPIYLVDVMVFSKSRDSHLNQLQLSLKRVGTVGLVETEYAYPEMRIRKRTIGFLGHLLGLNMAEQRQEKVDALLILPTPTKKIKYNQC